MHFEFRVEGPAEACGNKCRSFVTATGAITAESPREFEAFAKTHNVRGATLVLDSDGGSVLGALALGRAVRKLEMITMVGRLVDLDVANGEAKRARLVPRAYCESMCAFVLLAGVERYVPAEARVLVHQIWLGDRRDDPTAANYSAEDLVLVQRDIGRLAQYTVEMGGGIDLLEAALRIPPWEPMRQLSRDELRGMNIVTADDMPVSPVTSTTSSAVLASGTRSPSGDRSWMLTDNSGMRLLTRKHPLTIEGDDIGNFELSFSCGETAKSFSVSYIERRRVTDAATKPEPLTAVELMLLGRVMALKIVSSQSSGQPVELTSEARGQVPAELVRSFADLRSRSIMVETTNAETSTHIRIGNVGVAGSFKKLAEFCASREAAVRGSDLRPGKIAADQPR